MTRRRELDGRAGERTVSIGTVRLRVSGTSSAAATLLAQEVARHLAADAAGGRWRPTPGVFVSVPAEGVGQPDARRIAGAVGAALARGLGDG
jgi:hypothetical protein